METAFGITSDTISSFFKIRFNSSAYFEALGLAIDVTVFFTVCSKALISTSRSSPLKEFFIIFEFSLEAMTVSSFVRALSFTSNGTPSVLSEKVLSQFKDSSGAADSDVESETASLSSESKISSFTDTLSSCEFFISSENVISESVSLSA